jgi:hypothetical protein
MRPAEPGAAADDSIESELALPLDSAEGGAGLQNRLLSGMSGCLSLSLLGMVRHVCHDPGRFVKMLLTCRKRHTVLAPLSIGIRL